MTDVAAEAASGPVDVIPLAMAVNAETIVVEPDVINADPIWSAEPICVMDCEIMLDARLEAEAAFMNPAVMLVSPAVIMRIED